MIMMVIIIILLTVIILLIILIKSIIITTAKFDGFPILIQGLNKHLENSSTTQYTWDSPLALLNDLA